MNELLKAALLGKLSATVSSSSNLLEATAMEDPSRNEEVPLQNVPLDTSDDKPHKTLDLGPFQQPGNKKLRTSSQKAEPIRMGYFHNRHIFQQQLIEKQKKKLQEQQKTILELKKNQQLAEVPQAVGHGDARSCLLSNPREDEQERTCQRLSNSPVESPGTEHGRSESRNSLSGPRRNPRQLMAPHPILKAMEERAVQRAERRRILAERKKKQEEEKLAQLKAQEEERQKREAEEKEAKLEKKREEKRLKKMVSSVWSVTCPLKPAVVLCTFPPENLYLEQSSLTSTLFSILLNENLLIPQILAPHD